MSASVAVADGGRRWVAVACNVSVDMLEHAPADTTAVYLLAAWRAARDLEVPLAI